MPACTNQIFFQCKHSDRNVYIKHYPFLLTDKFLTGFSFYVHNYVVNWQGVCVLKLNLKILYGVNFKGKNLKIMTFDNSSSANTRTAYTCDRNRAEC